MILSFHPCFVADQNINCAGRAPDREDLVAVRKARAVVLPQGCSRQLYEMASRYCENVFPDYAARFAYPGKIGQIELFDKAETVYPRTQVYPNTDLFFEQHGRMPANIPLGYPLVFKFDWGGEGESVFYIDTPVELGKQINRAAAYEKSGQSGFLLQKFIPAGGRSLRVVVIGETVMSYWRRQDDENAFHTGLGKGAMLDFGADPLLQDRAAGQVGAFCMKTGINLAGFDLLAAKKNDDRLYLLEINYFFGRQGLGGSEAYYALLSREITKWLKTI